MSQSSVPAPIQSFTEYMSSTSFNEEQLPEYHASTTDDWWNEEISNDAMAFGISQFQQSHLSISHNYQNSNNNISDSFTNETVPQAIESTQPLDFVNPLQNAYHSLNRNAPAKFSNFPSSANLLV